METAKGLEFNAERHEYHFRGRKVPGVTSVLGPYNGLEHVDPDHLAILAEFGQHVHQAVDLWNTGKLVESALSTALVPYLDGWKQFLEDTGALVVYSEAKVYHSRLKYAGALDTIITLPNGRRVRAKNNSTNRLCDVKTGAALPPTVGPQTAGYNEAWHEMTGQRRMKRMCVHLNGFYDPEGQKCARGYTVHHFNDPRDWNIFKAALTLHRWKTGE